MSQYIFRGLLQTAGSAAAQGGLDYVHKSGFYAGIWSSQVEGNELEYDVYSGYRASLNEVTLDAGVTFYRYTQGEFDTAYYEVNLSTRFANISFNLDMGMHTEDSLGNKNVGYSVVSSSYTFDDAYVLYGFAQNMVNKDVNHQWLEFGYTKMIAPGTDLSFALIHSSKEANTALNAPNKANTSMVVGITKTFDIARFYPKRRCCIDPYFQ
jgi:uncharacterized protein (TIGR02001 family)